MKDNLDQQITENVPEFFFIWDLTRQNIVYLISSYKERATSKLKPKSAYERMQHFIHTDDRQKFRDILHSLTEERPYQEHDLKVNHHKYHGQWLNLRTFPIENEQGNIYRIVAHISDIAQRREELSKLENLKEKHEYIIHILAHDLKSPINNMMVLSSLAKKEIAEKENRVYQFLSMIEEAGSSVLKLAESILKLVELEEGHLSLNLQKHDLSDLLKKSVANFTHKAAINHIELTLQLPKKPVKIILDAVKVHHIIDNLLSNALKFTPEGGTVTVSLSQNQEYALLNVSDTGIGIDENQQQEIFKEFSRARRRGLHGEKGTGLGLSIVRRIVDLHQAKISVKSKQGAGTTFIVKFRKYMEN